jgi:aldehyde dehydrogenase (NAD+)
METVMQRSEFFIGGRWVAPRGGYVVDVTEAATGRPMGRVALGSPADVGRAVEAAAAAAPGWAATPAHTRADILTRYADELIRLADDTASLVSRQNGMPISQSVGANGHFPGIIVRYYAQLVGGAEEPDVRAGLGGVRALVGKFPVGVVAAITPWNYPQTLAAMKYAPALAAGCPVVIKPAPETTLDAYVLAEVAQAVGLPDGVLNIVGGDRDAGAELVAHSSVAKVAFTGSTAAGRAIGEICGRLLKPVTLELGGKSAAILLEDADIPAFLSRLLRVSLAHSGQTCHASTRILAPRGRYTEVVDALTAAVQALTIGDPLSPATQIGPLVSETQRKRVLDYVALGRSEGARLAAGGGVPADVDQGWFVQPTVLADVDNSWRVAQEEIFGPVLCVIPYADVDDAIRIANDSDYGLAGTVWTSDEDRGIAVARRFDSGNVGVNHFSLDPAAPFGGWKASGMGTELGPEGLQAYLRPQSVYLQPIHRREGNH